MKKVILVVYFGNLPNYFDLFLDSCSYNDDFDFIVFTDQNISPHATNIKVVHLSFDELNGLVARKLGDEYHVFSPYKLCDYRVAYGKVFEDYIADYAVWGYCDTDMLLGRISNFIDEEDFKAYDRLLVKGHLTFYKNSQKTNHYYLLTSPNYIGFQEAANIKEPCFVDEISMPGIMKEEGIDIYENWNFADILPQSLEMKVQEQGVVKNHESQKFYYENGRVYQEYSTNGTRQFKELMYIHLQKRAMTYDQASLDISKKIFINPNFFTYNEHETNSISSLQYSLMYYYKQIKKLGNVNRIRIKLKILITHKAVK